MRAKKTGIATAFPQVFLSAAAHTERINRFLLTA
jgi:hypothetical protein